MALIRRQKDGGVHPISRGAASPLGRRAGDAGASPLTFTLAAMKQSRTEREMSAYTEIKPRETSRPLVYALLATAAVTLALFIWFKVASGDRTAFFLLPLFVAFIPLLVIIHRFERCKVCNSRLNTYVNSDRTTNIADYYFYVCERCKTYSRHSSWADVG